LPQDDEAAMRSATAVFMRRSICPWRIVRLADALSNERGMVAS
jgi:hypothetical protein